MANLIQWRGYGSAGIQLFQDPPKARKSMMTIVVPDPDATKALLATRGVGSPSSLSSLVQTRRECSATSIHLPKNAMGFATALTGPKPGDPIAAA
jgi:hypothetical protein